MFQAAQTENVSIEDTKKLLALGLDINTIKDPVNNQYLLHVSVLAGNAAVVALLLEHGADLRIQNKEGQTVLDVAKKQRHNNNNSNRGFGGGYSFGANRNSVTIETRNEIIQLFRFVSLLKSPPFYVFLLYLMHYHH